MALGLAPDSWLRHEAQALTLQSLSLKLHASDSQPSDRARYETPMLGIFKGMEGAVSTIIKEESLSSMNLRQFSSIHLVLKEDDPDSLIKIEWPHIEGADNAELKVISQNQSEVSLHLLAAEIISRRKEQAS